MSSPLKITIIRIASNTTTYGTKEAAEESAAKRYIREADMAS